METVRKSDATSFVDNNNQTEENALLVEIEMFS